MVSSEGRLAEATFAVGVGAQAVFGCGAYREIPAALHRLGESRALIVTDPGVHSAGVNEPILRVLGDNGVAAAAFAGVRSNPTTLDVEHAAAAAVDFGAGAIVAVGGGSVLDVAKGAALVASNGGSARDFDYRLAPKLPGLPVVAVPTTAGTGSETNAFGVIEDEQTRHKFYVGHTSVQPKAVILDPVLTVGLPPRPTAAAGFDVLAHALESLSSRRANPYSAALAQGSVETVWLYLPRAVADGGDIEARSQLLLAAHMAGLAFAATGLGLAHALAHPLSALKGVPHGVALAVLVPHVLRFNVPVCGSLYARLERTIVSADADEDEAAAGALIDAVQALAREVDLPRSLRECGVEATLLPAIARDALGDEVIANTPRMPTYDQALGLLRDAL